MTCANCGSGTISALLAPGEALSAPVTCADCGAQTGTVTMTPIQRFDLAAATEDEMRRLSLYGGCPMCGTPRAARYTMEGTASTETVTVVQPCGHPRGPLT